MSSVRDRQEYRDRGNEIFLSRNKDRERTKKTAKEMDKKVMSCESKTKKDMERQAEKIRI